MAFHRYSQGIAGVAIGGMMLAGFASQTVFLKRYRSATASYKDGEEQPLSSQIEYVKSKVVDRMLIPSFRQKRINYFISYGDNPLHKGSVHWRFGALVGIPSTFLYDSEEDINKSSIKISGRDLDWASPEAAALADSLLLGDRAKAFVIARELYYCSDHSIVVRSSMQGAFAYMAYATGHVTNNLFGLKKRMKTWGRVGLYATIGMMYIILYRSIKEIYECRRDNAVDKKAAMLGVAYANGGVEYYDKVLTRNKALRKLMGNAGPEAYTAYGNDVKTFWRPSVPFTERRDHLVKHFNVLMEERERKQGVLDKKQKPVEESDKKQAPVEESDKAKLPA